MRTLRGAAHELRVADEAALPTSFRWDPHLSSPPGEERSVTALAHALLRNSTLALLGDSINNLLGVAFECEAAKASNGGAEWSLVHEGAAVPLTLLSQEYALSARLAALKEYNTRFGRLQGSWWDAPLVNHASGTVVVRKGYAKYNAVQLEQLLGVVDAVVINYGHHYAGVTLANYTDDMRALFAQLDAWVRSGAASGIARTALFRETGAQHFAGTGAFRSWDQAHLQLGDTCACEPHSDGAAHEDETTRMNAAVAALATQYPLVSVVPFWEVTQPRYDMHEGGFCGFGNLNGPQPCCDCTHLCYTPQLWRTVFSDVWVAAETQSEARRAAGLVRSGGHAVEAARLKAEDRVRERLDGRAKARAKELKKERMQHLASSLAPPPPTPPPAPRPTPPEQLFASASADDALAAAAAALAELAPAAPVAGLATVRASNASGETALEASSDAWFNKRPQEGSAPPSVQAGAAVLAAMHPQRAANVLATLEPELAGELLASMENGSAAPALELLGKEKLEELSVTAKIATLLETGDLAL